MISFLSCLIVFHYRPDNHYLLPTISFYIQVEELSEAMNGIKRLAQQVKDIKRIVDLFETQLLTGSLT